MINLSSQSRLTRKREKVSNIAYFNTVIQHHTIRHAQKKNGTRKAIVLTLFPRLLLEKWEDEGEGRRVNDSFPSMPRFLVFQCQCRRGSTLGARVKET